MPFTYHESNSRDNWKSAKCHTKPNKGRWNHKLNRRGFKLVRPQEVLEKLSDLGVVASQRSLQDYAKKGLIDKPTRQSLGRGAGSTSDYNDYAPYHYYASWMFLHGFKINSQDTKKYRELLSKIFSEMELKGDHFKEGSVENLIKEITVTLDISTHDALMAIMYGIITGDGKEGGNAQEVISYMKVKQRLNESK